MPPPKLFAYFNPILLNVEPLTLLWLNAFALNLQRSVKLLSVEQTDPPYLDVKIEAIMFRVSIWAFFSNFPSQNILTAQCRAPDITLAQRFRFEFATVR